MRAHLNQGKTGGRNRCRAGGFGLCRCLALCALALAALLGRRGAVQEMEGIGSGDEDKTWIGADVPPEPVRDPLEPVNRLTYHLNDRLYFWVLKPVARGYRAVVPKSIRHGFGNVFHNLGGPKRAVNCLLQGKFQGLADEWARFMLNSTIGVLGCRNIASDFFKIREWDEDFGQTLGVYGIGYGIYLNWPLAGPSNIRDTVGFIGDVFLDPLHYVTDDFWDWAAIKGSRQVNHASLHFGEYEENKALALDYYIWMRETYTQYRANLIKE